MQDAFFLTNWFLIAMKWLYGNLGSVFLTMLVSTVLLRCLTIFSDIKTRKSSQKMAVLQPEINKIQKKYKDDPRRAQQEQAKLMKANGASMWSSCLPLLITMPLFFCFFAAFRYWSYEETIRLLVSDDPASVLQSFRFLWVYNIWQPDNGLQPVIMKAATFLNTKDMEKLLYLKENPEVWTKLQQIGVAVKESVCTIGKDGAAVWTQSGRFITTQSGIDAYNTAIQPLLDVYPGKNNGWFLWPLISAGSNFLSMWLSQKSNPQPQQTGPDGKPAGMNQGKMMAYIFPIMSFVICLTATTAFAVYWTISSVMMIVINLILNKAYPREPLPTQEVKK